MDNAGIVFRKRNARQSKNQNHQVSNVKNGEGNLSPSFALANERFDLAMASLGPNNVLQSNSKPFKNDQWLSDQSLWGSMGTLPTTMPNSEPVNASAPSTDTDASQPVSNLNQPAGAPSSMPLPILPNSDMWTTDNLFPYTAQPMLAMDKSVGTSSDLQSVMPSTTPSSMNAIVDQNFVNLGEGHGTTAFESSTQGNPDLTLLTKPMAISLDKGASNPNLSTPSCAVGDSRHKHVETVRGIITDPKNMFKLAELSTRAIIDYQDARGLNSSLVTTSTSPTSVLLRSAPSDEGNQQDVYCVRVLSSTGELVYRPQQEYVSSLMDLYKKSIGMVEFPGTTRYDAQQIGVTDTFELFPQQQHWQESDFDSLKNQSQTLLKKIPTLTLIRKALKDLSFSLPFLQWSEIESYVSSFTLSSMTVTCSPLQSRQRQSVLLLLCALGSSLVPAVNVTAHAAGAAQAALPWELGLKCFSLARGLLCPMEGILHEEEKTLDFVQCMILMSMFMVRCQDKQSAWSPLAYGDSVASHLLSSVSSPSGTDSGMSHFFVEREMLKRCVWMLFMLEIITRVKKDTVQNQSLWSDYPFKLEQPISLAGLSLPCGPADACVTQETLRRFISQTELCQIMVSVLLLRLHESMPRTEEVNEVVRTLQRELSKWVSNTPCLVRTGASPTTPHLGQSWHPPSVIPLPALYEACSFYLARANV